VVGVINLLVLLQNMNQFHGGIQIGLIEKK